MEMRKARMLRLKAPKKHSITHIMHIEMENVISSSNNNNNNKELERI